MPMASSFHGESYYPQPVGEHLYEQPSISEAVSSASSVRLTQRTTSVNKTKRSKQLRQIPSKTKWTTKKKVIVGVIVAVIVLAVIGAGVFLAVWFTRNTNSTGSATVSSTAVITAYWTFDAVTNDYFGVYNGTLINGATYFSTSTTNPFVGYGRGLSLTSTSSQYFTVISPFLDLSFKSFTIEARIFPIISSSTDFGIFSTFQCFICTNLGLSLIIRNYQLFVIFTNNDLAGNTTLVTSTWYHIAFVYNYETLQQIIYINGVQDAIKSNAAPYQGINGTLLIGAAQAYSLLRFFNGYIDNFKITTRAKSAAEILTAATLIAYFPFDFPSATFDFGPNGLNGSSTNVINVNGRIKQALRFTGSSSYFQSYGFYQIGYAVTNNRPFSVAIWISPVVATSCAIMQISPYLTSGSCHNMLGLTSALGVTAQVLIQGWAWPVVYGPVVPLNTWTHITLTYSFTTGLTLYTNGTLIGNTGSFTFGASGVISYVQLGYFTSCSSGVITNAAYQGIVDEMYIYSRELTQSEAVALANP